ncbi:hypothetical protein AHAS_Ahas18G0080100 [Arachis hypogaea]
MPYTLVLTFEGGDLVPVEVSPMTDFCIRYPNLIRKDMRILPVSLTRSGYHYTFLPSQNDYEEGSEGRLMYGFIYLFSLCRALRLAKRIDRSILKSIVTPSTGLPRQSQLRNDIVALSKDLILRYFPSFLSTPLCQGVRWEPGKRDLRGGRKGEKTRGGIFYPTICVMKSFGLYINSHCDYDAGFPLRHFGESIDSGSPGRLSQSTEAGAGKRRIFAIGNFVNQRVLKPLHDFLIASVYSNGWNFESAPTVRWIDEKMQSSADLSLKYLSSLSSRCQKVYPGQRFTRYAILGDDVCIADENVAWPLFFIARQ